MNSNCILLSLLLIILIIIIIICYNFNFEKFTTNSTRIAYGCKKIQDPIDDTLCLRKNDLVVKASPNKSDYSLNLKKVQNECDSLKDCPGFLMFQDHENSPYTGGVLCKSSWDINNATHNHITTGTNLEGVVKNYSCIKTCHPGEKLNDDGITCSSCPPNHYNKNYDNNTSCLPCDSCPADKILVYCNKVTGEVICRDNIDYTHNSDLLQRLDDIETDIITINGNYSSLNGAYDILTSRMDNYDEIIDGGYDVTMAPTTMAPTTMAPTTMPPNTMAPTTMAPTTTGAPGGSGGFVVPAGEPFGPAAPASSIPPSVTTTMAPTTMAPTTMAPTTMAPTTMAPTTMAPTTTDAPEGSGGSGGSGGFVVPAGEPFGPAAPASSIPPSVTTTMAPTTMAPTTMAPTTMAPTTMAPTTMAPTTTDAPGGSGGSGGFVVPAGEPFG